MKTDKEAKALQVIPNHVAVIMDGNGRWAKQRGLVRTEGHREGLEAVKRVTKAANKWGVKVLTLYAFSTENWKRPPQEIKYLMNLPIAFFDKFMPELMENNIKVMTSGTEEGVPGRTIKTVQKVIDQTKDNDGMVLNLAFNYGSREEITRAVRLIGQDILDHKLEPKQVDDKLIASYLYTNPLGQYADVDLMIRTSGEERLSNFLLWQNAYSEFYFSPLYWPDFNEEAFDEILEEYQGRNRRFGGL
ncbi:Undecaprenyl pyrophosphate synthase [Alloiococcus otitis]|uniref:Isoprenyl transferase n=1 Tax=Alloiococcus otitis ATCC 51267 TaxID=883081 RepID=K9EAK8_9LACT|nr:isoprenyl transferase [Alloiococcus otitis]EKU94274.1 di-trans,poly-cis-decaprenylcistransferase [Alloiococcus otitis ATCC 51267]SUU81092.1 Undecaprenyl pyrophosphate synthase [Alloiococcus otitis]